MGEVIKSPLDTNDYKAIRLENGITALLISTCTHPLDLDDKKLNKTTCAFNKLQQFNQEYIEMSNLGCKGTMGRKSGSQDRKKNTNSKKKKNPKCKTKADENFISVALVVGAGMYQDPPEIPGV